MSSGVGRVLCLGLIVFGLAGCATSSSKIRPTYVSPLLYKDSTCRQIAQEADRVSRRAAEVAGVQDREATEDAVATTVGVLVLWPTLFFVEGDGQAAAELARLKGEFEALEKAAIEKDCDLEFRTKAESAS